MRLPLWLDQIDRVSAGCSLRRVPTSQKKPAQFISPITSSILNVEAAAAQAMKLDKKVY